MTAEEAPPMTDQPRDELAEVLGSQAYATAFDAVMTGTEPGLLPDDQREALRRARDLTGTPGPGYPVPTSLDPTRNRTGRHVEGGA
jgi:hypothetical protein